MESNNTTKLEKAEKNVKEYLKEFLIKKEKNQTAKQMYLKNSKSSLQTAEKLLALETETYKPHLWVIVISYYSTYYIANAALLELGYKVGSKISHKVTEDALIVFVRHKLKKQLTEDYKIAREEALELTNNLIKNYGFEREKRGMFQYEMGEEIKKAKAKTSLQRAKEFVFEMKKIIQA